MNNDELILLPLITTDQPPLPIAPSIAPQVQQITILAGQGATNIIDWADSDTSPSNPIEDVVLTGVGMLGPLSNLTLVNGTATWSISNAQTGDSGIVSFEITDGDGLTAQTTFLLTVNEVPVPPDGTTQCGPHLMPTTVTVVPSLFSNGVLSLLGQGVDDLINPDWFDLNGQELNFTGPVEDTQSDDWDCVYPEVIVDVIDAHPDLIMCPTIHIALTLAYDDSGAGGWVIVPRIFVDPGCGFNGGDNVSLTTPFIQIDEEATGFATPGEADMIWPPAYDGSLTTWAGHFTLTDSAHANAPTAALTAELNPLNPSINRITMSVQMNNPFATVLSSQITVRDGPTEVVIPGPLPPIVDLSQFAGSATVELAFQVTDSTGATSAEASQIVNVPAFTSDITVDSGEGESTTNRHSLASAISLTLPGGRVTVIDDTIVMSQDSQPSSYPIGAKDNITIRSVGTRTQISGNETSNVIFSVAGSQNSRVEGFEFTKTLNSIAQLNATVDGFVFWDCIADDCLHLAFYVTGATNTIVGECIGRNTRQLETGPGSNGRSSGTPFFTANAAAHVLFWMDVAEDNRKDGFGVTESTTHAEMMYCLTQRNGRQGVVTKNIETLRCYECDFLENAATGAQVEAVSSFFTTNVEIDSCRMLENTHFSDGETGGWADDFKDLLIQNSVISENFLSGLRIDSDTGRVSERAIVRYNRIIGNGTTTSWQTGPHDFRDPPQNDEPVGNRSGIGTKGSTHVAIYGNTIQNTGHPDATVTYGFSSHPLNDGLTPDADITFLNNIVADTSQNTSGDARQVILGNGKSSVRAMDGNVYSGPPNTTTGYLLGKQGIGTPSNFATFKAAMSPFEANSFEFADLMLDGDQKPLAGSPVIGKAQPLAAVNGVPAGLDIPLSNTDVVHISVDPSRSDELVFPNGVVKAISKTATHVTIDALPPGGIANGHAMFHNNPQGKFADSGAVQS
jgi:hypothetical protein